MKKLSVVIVVLFVFCFGNISAQRRIDFNSDWTIGDNPQSVTLPRAWNESEAFKNDIAQLSDSVMWYRKTFKLSKSQIEGKKVFVEFEGVRHAGEFFINGQRLGLHENGVMAVGFDLTPYVKPGKNLIEVRTDNDWNYHEVATNSTYQWNSKNFNANYGGLSKRVWLHITPQVYQTLPLYSNLGTTGTYVYATDMNVKAGTATINVETEIKNESAQKMNVALKVPVPAGLTGKESVGETVTINPGETRTVSTHLAVSGIDWWSWGHGALYDVKSVLLDESGKEFDNVTVRTGFRKTQFGNGLIWLNNRVLMMKGYAQRTTNEWPGLGIDVPEWLSDYSNALMVEGGANLVRWMHVTPSKQDIESCDRVGLIEAMPAGDAEKDIEGRRWEQRTELMRDAIIYNRNNPSIIFYEGGNESISREHMLELKAIRDKYDPHGGRAIGSREMLDINEAEYGGEMLYINKSKKHPMWAMEYCRDEGLRKNWDEWSYPFHKEGDGPLYRNQPSGEWHHNQDQLAIEWVRRWYDYWRERPGTGTRVSSGGVKIIFSDTNTHHRGSVNYRTSGATDAMRIPKDGFFAHQVMWHGWVENDNEWQTYIIGHWNYEEISEQAMSLTYNAQPDFCKPVYVVSNSDSVCLFLNGRRLNQQPKREYHFLYTFPKVEWEPGTLEAVSYDLQGREQSRYAIHTAGSAKALKLTALTGDNGNHQILSDGKDLALLQIEVVDSKGQRQPLDNSMIHFSLEGPAEWIGGIAVGAEGNYVGSMDLPVECGINRAFIRGTTKAGRIKVTATAKGFQPATIEIESVKALASPKIPAFLKSKTPEGASFVQSRIGIPVISAKADKNQEQVEAAYDDNELSEWKGGESITFTLEKETAVEDICIKLAGWRSTRYPIQVYAGESLVWDGTTPTSLGYVHLEIANPVKAKEYTIKIKGQKTENNDQETAVQAELGGGKANELDQVANTRRPTLRIVEVEFLVSIQKKE